MYKVWEGNLLKFGRGVGTVVENKNAFVPTETETIQTGSKNLKKNSLHNKRDFSDLWPNTK